MGLDVDKTVNLETNKDLVFDVKVLYCKMWAAFKDYADLAIEVISNYYPKAKVDLEVGPKGSLEILVKGKKIYSLLDSGEFFEKMQPIMESVKNVAENWWLNSF